MLKQSNIDIRNEFELLQKEFSIDILYVRATKYIRCKCFNELHQTGDSNCHICFGTGHVCSVEKMNVIMYTLRPEGLSSGVKVKGPLMTSSPIIELYIHHSKMPKVRDNVIVTGWNIKGLPQDVKKVGTISSIDEIRGDNGRVEFYSVVVTIVPELLKPSQKLMNKLDDTAKKIIAKGGRYVWPFQK